MHRCLRSHPDSHPHHRVKYRPNHYSELLLGRDPSCDCYLGCRIGTDAIATDIATYGESTRNEQGRTIGKVGRQKLLRTGWQAFESVPDNNGIPDQGDVTRIHRAMFPNLPSPTLVTTEDFGGLWDHHGEYAISWALRLSAVPASSVLRKYVGGVDHQMVTYRDEKARTRVMCPMKPHSLTYRGHVDEDLRKEIRTAAKAIEDGLIIAELYPVGAWTQAARVRKRKNDEIADLQEKIGQKNDRIDELEREAQQAQTKGWDDALDDIITTSHTMKAEGP